MYSIITILHAKNNELTYQRQVDIHSYNTRNYNSFTLKKHKKEKFKRSPTCMGTQFINYLPDSIKQEKKIKQKYKTEKLYYFCIV